ncbi:Maf family protein [Thermincola potens]|uniref:dTTP/UTP pyrophosphatase n=1 Tax=Thermincola potens (strain JR) TaxID=635013 RepID=D5XBF6_THEPJ|nr:Maf family protein [Thermincola potens]ADG83385.1 maf protein [Thermincola potens JR]
MKEIILASASPRRRELLDAVGLPYKVQVSAIDEKIPAAMTPADTAMNLALQKAQNVAGKFASGIVIGADTIVVLNGHVLGKPKDKTDAVNMLQALRGTTHQVITGLAVIDAEDGKTVQAFEETEVCFKNISDDDINAYVATGEPMDKAGAYGIQGLGGLFVAGIRGCYFNVVGLPIPLLAEILKGFGVDILRFRKDNNREGV